MKRSIYLWALMASVFCFTACEDDDTVTTILPQEQELSYSGTVLDFISQADGYEGYRFDSLLYVVSNIKGMADSLSQTNHGVTLFAAPDESFAAAHQALVLYRKSQKLDEGTHPLTEASLGADVNLKDLMIAPFEVIDTVIGYNPVAATIDTSYVHRHYDYQENLRQLAGRYVFMKYLSTSGVIDGAAYKSLFDHEMNLQFASQDASGMVNAGRQAFQLVETRGSKQQAVWVKAEIAVCNVKCSNGYVHILAPRHEFGFNEITSYFANYGNEKKK